MAQKHTHFSNPKTTTGNPKDENTGVRLNKFIASSGLCTRREADKLIVEGMISINGEIITELGSKVLPKDNVLYNGKELKSEKHVYVLLNKPKNTATTPNDSHTKLSVFDLIKKAGSENILPAGNLDKDTTGVLLFTNDSDIYDKLSDTNYNKMSIYHAYLDKDLLEADYSSILKGFDLDGAFIKADALSYVDDDDKTQIGIEIRCGDYNIVKRVFSHFNYKIVKLDRAYFAGLTKKGLQRSHWRHLTKTEVASLKMGSFK